MDHTHVTHGQLIWTNITFSMELCKLNLLISVLINLLVDEYTLLAREETVRKHLYICEQPALQYHDLHIFTCTGKHLCIQNMTSFLDCLRHGRPANVVVSKNGDGHYATIEEAVQSIPGTATGRYVIYIKSGVYQENVVISKPNVTLVGDGKKKTIISSSLNNDDGYSILNSAAVGMF